MHGFRCYDNIHVCKLIALYTANAYSAEREMSASACTRSMAGYTRKIAISFGQLRCGRRANGNWQLPPLTYGLGIENGGGNRTARKVKNVSTVKQVAKLI